MAKSQEGWKTLTIRMPNEMYGVLKDSALYGGMSLNTFMIGTLMKYAVQFLHEHSKETDIKREQARKRLLDWASKEDSVYERS